MWYRLTLIKRQRKPMGQSRMDKPEKLATPSTQDTGRRQTKQKTQNTTQKLKRGATRTPPKPSYQTLLILHDICRPTRTHCPDSKPTNLRSFSLMLRA